MNEFDFINKLRRRVADEANSASSVIPQPASLVRGIGDDAAVFKSLAGNDVVVAPTFSLKTSTSAATPRDPI